MGDITAKDIVIPLFVLVSSLIPLATLVWKFALMSAKVGENSKDIDGIARKFEEEFKSVDAKKDEQDTQIQQLGLTMSRIEAKLDMLLKDVEASKPR
jgi:hypothetical protein